MPDLLLPPRVQMRAELDRFAIACMVGADLYVSPPRGQQGLTHRSAPTLICKPI